MPYVRSRRLAFAKAPHCRYLPTALLMSEKRQAARSKRKQDEARRGAPNARLSTLGLESCVASDCRVFLQLGTVLGRTTASGRHNLDCVIWRPDCRTPALPRGRSEAASASLQAVATGCRRTGCYDRSIIVAWRLPDSRDCSRRGRRPEIGASQLRVEWKLEAILFLRSPDVAAANLQ